MAAATTVYVGIGSNIEPFVHIPRGLELLQEQFGALTVSPAYRCPAVGFAGADFLNLVVAFASTQEPAELVRMLHELERRCGRTRGAGLSSRTMDMDLLLFGQRVVDCDTFALPRDDILRYAFVLRPLADIAGAARHPVDGRSYAQLWNAFDASDQPLERVLLETA